MMKSTKTFLSAFISTLSLSVLTIPAAFANSLVNTIVIPGNATDLSGQPNSPNGNRLGGFFSDLYYDKANNVYYGLSDRGPGGGTIAYDTRVQKFTLDVDLNTGAISNFNLLDTILFTQNGQNFDGLNPRVLNGDSAVLGLSFDPEGFVVAPNGNFYVSDEYGPSVYEFDSSGSFLRAFMTPDNLIPKEGATSNYVDGRGTITTGRQDNRGFEGLAISPDGTKLLAMLQDPLVNEGTSGTSDDGRYSGNLRIVEFDTITGNSTAQYIYQLESLVDINDRIPGTANDFPATSQGRNIGISAIIAINNHEFLVLERDNRGLGVDAPTVADVANTPVGSKRIYSIDITGATDVSGISLAGTNTLPGGIIPVSKSLFLDIQTALDNAGQIIPEKIEGLAIGPQLNDGSYALLIGTDSDYSVTQNGSNVQFNVCTDFVSQSVNDVAIQDSCPQGLDLIPTYLYSFKESVPDFVPRETVPEPSAILGLISLGLGGVILRKGRKFL
ncbi:esterase-like activity of phytase family protein [Crocosphaera sp. UHCC 0190]|uniref:esterase-like activity of phytase family protein n=1 Tax=Crocosphaera sp. UHCC 0190 TaxID=3110246 RepID=UPI002B1EF45C|nr:esterase-like activity of phytase family protein [Crocosphaera sp. UHCC 0190]MEA5510540.1 esterase-like activity of phytase family protein [Crocosphaera sp. UHCC 0190]